MSDTNGRTMTDTDTDQPVEYEHETFDHRATRSTSTEPHDRTVPELRCKRCHDDAHDEWEADVLEVVDGTVTREPDHVYAVHTTTDEDGNIVPIFETTLPPDAGWYRPTAFLNEWHLVNGYCPRAAPNAR